MGRRGPKAQSDYVKLLRGNPHKSKLMLSDPAAYGALSVGAEDFTHCLHCGEPEGFAVRCEMVEVHAAWRAGLRLMAFPARCCRHRGAL